MPSILFENGPIYPMNRMRLNGGAVLTKGAEIAYVGPAEGVAASDRRGANRVDLAGRPLLPGFCDSHLHLMQAATQYGGVDLCGAEDIGKLQARVRQRAAETPPGSWVVGHGWERRLLLVDRQPSVALLDEATCHHPVFLTSKDLHSAWLNSAALARAAALGKLPEKCVIQRIDGEPTGLVLEDLFGLQQCLLPTPSDADKERLLRRFARQLWSCGITSVHAFEEPGDVDVILRAAASSAERVRVLANVVAATPKQLSDAAELFQHAIEGWLCMGSAKLFLDGTFGSLTAAVSHPYVDGDDRGQLTMDAAELRCWLETIRKLGITAALHAIGDRAVELALDGLAELSWPEGTRHRIEHAQLLSPRIVERCDLRNVVASGQPSHMWADREIVERALPDANARRWTYPYRTLMECGALVVFGSDAPVETVDPWKGIAAAVTRLQTEDAEPWIGQEKITLTEALTAHTLSPALLHGHGFNTGALAPGRCADLVVLERDPFALLDSAPLALRDGIGVDATYLDGELVYARPGAGS